MSSVRPVLRRVCAVAVLGLLLTSSLMVSLNIHPAGGAGGWWNADWPYRKVITIDHTKVGSDLSNFPVLIDVIDTDLSKAQANGNDVVFTDEFGVKLNHEIEYFSTATGRLVAWVSANLSAGSDTILYVYYGNSTAPSQQNKTGVWRPIDSTVHGYDSPDCLWQPGDVFADPAMGVAISIGGITHYNSSDPSNSPYTADDVATIMVRNNTSAPLFHNVVLSNAQFKELTTLTFDTNMELQQRIPNANANNGGTYTYVREESILGPGHLVIAKANGSILPAAKITDVTVNPAGVQVTLAKGTFASAADASGATIATRSYYHFGAGAAVRLTVSK